MKKNLVMTLGVILLTTAITAQEKTGTNKTTTTVTPTNEPPVATVVTTRKGGSTVVTIPETTTTTTVPERVLVKEALLTWLAIGLRTSLDYHFTPEDAALSCLWLFGEVYQQSWGVEAGVGYMRMPIRTYTDPIGFTYNGDGWRYNMTLDLIAKWYPWFARWLWLGAGVNYAGFSSGYIRWLATGATATGTNPVDANAVQTFYRYTPIIEGRNYVYGQVGLGVKIAMGYGFNPVHLTPDIRFLVPLNADKGTGMILRFNLAATYSMGF